MLLEPPRRTLYEIWLLILAFFGLLDGGASLELSRFTAVVCGLPSEYTCITGVVGQVTRRVDREC